MNLVRKFHCVKYLTCNSLAFIRLDKCFGMVALKWGDLFVVVGICDDKGGHNMRNTNVTDMPKQWIKSVGNRPDYQPFEGDPDIPPPANKPSSLTFESAFRCRTAI